VPPSHTARAPSRAPSRAHPTIPTCRISLWLDFLHATLVFAKEQRFSAAKVPTHHSPDAKSRRKTTNRSIAQGAGFVRPHPVARKPCGQRLGRKRGCCGRWFKHTFLCAVVLECSLRCYRRAACFLPKLLLLSGTRVDQGNGTQRTLFAGKHTCQQMSHPRRTSSGSLSPHFAGRRRGADGACTRRSHRPSLADTHSVHRWAGALNLACTAHVACKLPTAHEVFGAVGRPSLRGNLLGAATHSTGAFGGCRAGDSACLCHLTCQRQKCLAATQVESFETEDALDLCVSPPADSAAEETAADTSSAELDLPAPEQTSEEEAQTPADASPTPPPASEALGKSVEAYLSELTAAMEVRLLEIDSFGRGFAMTRVVCGDIARLALVGETGSPGGTTPATH